MAPGLRQGLSHKQERRKRKRERKARGQAGPPTPVAVRDEILPGPSVVLIDHRYVGPFSTRKEAIDWGTLATVMADSNDFWVFPVIPPAGLR